LLERQVRRLAIGDAPNADQWREFLSRVDRAYIEADQDRYTLERALDLSSDEMRKRYTELRAAQQALIEASRRAGMADVAASMLHNIGNVLNSVNVSSNVVADCVAHSARGGLEKSLKLLATQTQPGAFLDHDPRGQQVLPYLQAVDRALAKEQAFMQQELQSLTKHVEHMKSVVSEQLAATRPKEVALMVERLALDELVRDAIDLSELRGRAGVAVVVDLEPLIVEVDRHKVIQILVNLLRNACDAIAVTGRGGTVHVRACRESNCQAVIDVRDDGVGISKEVMARLFNVGVTTKPHGNGYGLHQSACQALELGGSLACTSDGLGAGACFRLAFPRKRGATLAECRHLSTAHMEALRAIHRP
jgi:signal transduction histidine kinase